MSDLTANGCGCSNQGLCGGNNCIWIILLLLFCGGNNGCQCGGSGFIGNCSGGNNCCTWIILLLLLSNCCGSGNDGCGCGSTCC